MQQKIGVFRTLNVGCFSQIDCSIYQTGYKDFTVVVRHPEIYQTSIIGGLSYNKPLTVVKFHLCLPLALLCGVLTACRWLFRAVPGCPSNLSNLLFCPPLMDMPLSVPAVYLFSCFSLSITLVPLAPPTLLTFVCRSCLLDCASLVTFALVNILCQTKTAWRCQDALHHS